MLEHKKSKRMAFKREMERIRHQGEDRPSLPPPNALPRRKLDPIRQEPQRSPIKSVVRSLNASVPNPEKLAPLSPLAAQMKLKILKDSSLSKIQASPLDPLNVGFIRFSRLVLWCRPLTWVPACLSRCLQGGYGRREQYFKNLNKSRSIMKDSAYRPANMTMARKQIETKGLPEISSAVS